MKFAIDVREVGEMRAGKGYYVFELVNHLAQIDHENEYVLYTNKSFLWQLPKNFSLKVVLGRSIMWHKRLASQMEKDSINAFLSTLSYLSALFSSVPTVLVVHDLAVFYAPIKSKRKSVIAEKLTLNRAAKRAERIIAVSETTKSELNRFNPSFGDKTVVAPNAVSDRFCVASREEVSSFIRSRGLPDKYILFVGTLEPRKGISALIGAYAQLDQEIQEEYRLIIAGKKGWYYEEIFDLVGKLGLKERVGFPGYIAEDDLPLLYNGASLFVFPSVYEGFGLPVLEAMKCGTPTITSDAPALVEVGDGAALSVHVGDVSGLATQMQKVLTDSVLSRLMVEKGLEIVKKYDWKKSAKITLDTLIRAVKQ
ncbi:MAG: glycosyltransferase family 1 protein [Patescibacteria group bacterium]|jgi:glycosyltransferase involved in cell wall biosynthesis